MNIKLTFLGAAKNVTGSCYLVETNGRRILVDCGLYQERDFKYRNWEPFHVAPNSIDTVLITHAHLDHCGLLPKLARDGFKGKIHSSTATLDIAKIVLMDSARIQEEDVAHKKKRHKRQKRKGPYPLVPLYTVQDAENVVRYFESVPYKQIVPLGQGLDVFFYDSGHIFGSTMIRIKVTQDSESRTILFSGDVGRNQVPILRDPAHLTQADYVVVESTYGNRIHAQTEDIPTALEKVINDTAKHGGNIVIPSFTIERTQELLYYLGGLLEECRIPRLKVFLDSPMAIRVTEVFKKYPELFDKETLELLHNGRHPCDFPGLHLARSVEESKAINDVKEPIIIIAGSGMCTGGRIKHHLLTNISRPDSTILFVGYQAIGTLGRTILDGAGKVRLFGEMYSVKAKIARIHGFSAHADRDELCEWLSALQQPPRCVFITHGEPEAAEALAKAINQRFKWSTLVPEYLQTSRLD